MMIGRIAKTDLCVGRGVASSLYAAKPNRWLTTRFLGRTSPLANPSIWPLRIVLP
jgi:hypothetical protein